MATIRLVPVSGRSTEIQFGGRAFPPNAPYDAAPNDQAVVVLQSNGWTGLPLRGHTSERPTQAPQGSCFIDIDIDSPIWAVCWPNKSGNVVGWVDLDGNAA